MSEPPAGPFALLVGVQTPLDSTLEARGGTVLALRQIEARLRADGWRVRVLLDDAPTEASRPFLANIIDAFETAGRELRPLVLLSGHVLDGTFAPRDARQRHIGRTGLPLTELADLLPAGARVLADCQWTPAERLGWSIVAAPGDTSSPDGPSQFLVQLGRALGSGAVDAETLATLMTARAGAQVLGTPSGPLVGKLATATRQCQRCEAVVEAAAATFCPACGAPMGICETLDNGRYRLLRAIGSGGMGAVYLAEDTRLSVQRALKVLSLPPELGADDARGLRERLIQEARAAQALAEKSHHVVRVFDVGYSPERAEPFLVMELLDGVTLGQRLGEGRMAVAEALRLVKDIAEPLAIAHASGMVHRDLKPENVMLVRRGPVRDFVKLLDFGLVKMAGPIQTRSGQMMGTLQYMPPEQLRGMAVDARADVFALGALLYECLSGVRAIPGRTQQAIFSTLLDTGIEPLDTVRPGLPLALCRLVDSCLALDRADRPVDAAAVIEALSRLDELGHVQAPASQHLGGLPTDPPREADLPSVTAGEIGAVSLAQPRWGAKRLAMSLVAVGCILALATWWLASPAATHSGGQRAGTGVVDAGVNDAAPADGAVADAGELTVDAASVDAAGLVVELSALPSIDIARARGDGARIEYVGGSRLDRFTALVVDLALAKTPPGDHDVAASKRWAVLSPAMRRFLAEASGAVDIARWRGERLWVAKDALGAARGSRARPIPRLRGLGTFWATEDRAIVQSARCRGLSEGDRVLTLQWSTRGYEQVRCDAGLRCLRTLARDLKQARRVAERLDARLTVTRETNEGAELVRRAVDCRVAP